MWSISRLSVTISSVGGSAARFTSIGVSSFCRVDVGRGPAAVLEKRHAKAGLIPSGSASPPLPSPPALSA